VTTPEGAAGDELLLERAGALRILAAAAEQVRQGTGDAMTLRASAGMGKTSVLASFARTVSPASEVTLVQVSARQGVGRPDALARAFTETLADELDAATWRACCTGAAGRVVAELAGGAVRDPTMLVHGLGWLASNAAAAGPLLVLVDDAHFAEPLGRALIDELAWRAGEISMLLVVAERDDSPAVLPDHRVVRLDPLSVGALDQLGVRRLGASATGCGSVLSELCGGNALEACRLLEAAARLGDDGDDGDEVPVVDRLCAAAAGGRARIDAAVAHPLEEIVAVAGSSATCALVGAVLGRSSAAVRREADDLGLVVDGELLVFGHSLDEADAYQRLSEARRQRVHRMVAEALAAEAAPPELVGAHLARAGTARDDDAIDLLVTAAAASRRAGHLEAAAEALAAIDPAAVDPGDRHGLWRRRGDIAARLGHPSASHLLSEAAAAADDAEERVDDEVALARWLFQAGRPQTALEQLDVGIASAPPALAPRLALERARIARFVLPRRHEAARHLADLLDGSAGLDHIDAGTRAEIAFEQAATVDQGAASVRRLALDALGDGALLASEGADGLSWWWACYALHLAGDNEAAARTLSAAVQDAQARGSRTGFVQAIALRSGPQLHLGHLEDASADAELAIAAGRRAHRVFLPSTRGALAQLRVWRGDLAGAQRLIAAQHDEGRVGAGSDMLFLYGEAVVELASGHPDRALARLEEAGREQELGGGNNPSMIPWRSLAAEALVGLGRLDEASALARTEVALAERFGAPGPIGIARRGLALTIDGDDRIELLRSACDAHEQGERRVEHLQAMVDLGVSLHAAGAVLDARAELREAMGAADALGARRLVDEARVALVAAGGRPRRTATRGPSAMTPAERRVLDLAARGWSNREIAEQLFVGLKAVEWHLTSSYRKLGVRCRSEAIDAVSCSRQAS
jgi:DNA-binding NarL/FixJ family response regulator